jgi:hypothetical protein
MWYDWYQERGTRNEGVSMTVVCRTCAHGKVNHASGYCYIYDCDCRRYIADITYPKKMTTKEFRSRLAPRLAEKGAMCWGNVLAAFGVEFTPTGKPASTGQINLKLIAGGYAVDRVRLEDIMPGVPHETMYTLAVFFGRPEHLTGDWVIYLNGHVICVRDGRITDTMGQYQTVSRRVESVFRITRAVVPAANGKLSLAASVPADEKKGSQP